jgi:hypothetical protein
MNQFSELLGTNIKINIKLQLSAIVDNGVPTTLVKYNNKILLNQALDSSICITWDHDLLDPICIQVALIDKIYNNQKETAIIIESLTIDDVEVIPKYNNLITYVNDHNIDTPTNYLGFNGVWELCIPTPFYQGLHHVQGQGLLIK